MPATTITTVQPSKQQLLVRLAARSAQRSQTVSLASGTPVRVKLAA